MEIGAKIKKIRESKGLTQKQLAEKIGVTPVTITRYENNNREPNIETLNKIAKVLEVTINDLMIDYDKKMDTITKSLLGTPKFGDLIKTSTIETSELIKKIIYTLQYLPINIDFAKIKGLTIDEFVDIQSEIFELVLSKFMELEKNRSGNENDPLFLKFKFDENKNSGNK